MTDQPTELKVAFLGFGEAGRAFATGWATQSHLSLSAYDIKTNSDAAQDMWQAYRSHGVRGGADVSDAVQGADMVMSFVTADQALTAAETAAPVLTKGTLFLDCNSCSPQTKIAASAAVAEAGGIYVDAAVMAPVHPGLHQTPLLLSGPRATDAKTVADTLGMSCSIVGDRIGDASGIKLCRSVIVKGLEALSAEAFLAAHALGVVDIVTASLDASYPGFDWKGRGATALERMASHGKRRAAEMQQASSMLRALGLPSNMSDATTSWQTSVAKAAGSQSSPRPDALELSDWLDHISGSPLDT